MSKKGKDFKAGDFIFAKVKGYPAWPARIRGKNGKKFFVYFYGTGETANLMANVLYDYNDNKDKFLAKAIKRRDFNDGLLQINYEIDNNIPLPAEGEEPVAQAESAGDADKDGSTVADSTMEVDADTTLNETAESGDDSKINDNAVNDSAVDDSAVEDSAVNDSAVEDSAVNDSAVNDTTKNESALDESVDQDDSDEANPPLVIDEDKKTRKSKAPATPRAESKRKPVIPTPSKTDVETLATPTTGRGRPRAKRVAEDSPTVVATPAKKRRHIETLPPAEEPENPTEEPAEESTNDPKTSDKSVEESETQDKDDAEAKTETPLEVIENSDVTAGVATPKAKTGGRPKTQYNNVSLGDLSDLKEPFKEVLAEDGKPKQNVLLVRLPNQRYVGIKLFQDRPKTFKTPAAKLSWESQMAQNAIDLRHKLEAGLIKPSHIPNEIVTELNLSDEDKKNIEKEKEIEENRYRLNFLRAEMKLGELTAKIKCNLGLQKADTKACLALMEELLTLEIKPLMLYKNHKIVETIKRLRSYVGDTHNWTMTEDELEQFTRDASRIRKKAEECYQCFKLLFPEPAEGVTFFQQFSQKHGLFHACTKSLSEDEMLELVHEPAEMLDSGDSIQPILDAMNDDDDEEVPKKRRKTTNTPAKSTPAADTRGKRGRPTKRTTQTDTETIEKTNDVPPNVEDNEKEVKEKLEEAVEGSSAMEVDQSSGITDAGKENSEASGETPNAGVQSIDKSNDKVSSNKSEKPDKESSKGGSGDATKDKDKDKHSRSSDKVTEKSVKSRSDDSSRHSSSSKHSKNLSEKDKSTSKTSESSGKSSSKSEKAKSDRKSIQDKEDSSSLKKTDDDEKAGTSSSTKDSDKAEDRGDRKRDKSTSGLNGTEKEGDTDKSTGFSKADKVRKSSSSSSHQSDSSKYSSKKKSVK